MPKGIPSTSRPEVAPIPDRRIANAPLVKIGAFKAMQRRKNKAGEEYEVEQVKLSLDFDTGKIMRDPDGNPVLDENGEEQPHYINEGFVTLSGNEKAKFMEILRALGLDSPDFIQKDGRDKGSLTQEAAESLEATFGVNGLGDDYSNADWDDLPFYVLPSKGGKERKRDVEVPVLSLKILGIEIIGRWLDMSLRIDGDWNRVDAFFPSEQPAPLTESAPARSMPVEKKHATDKPIHDDGEDTPLDPEPPFSTEDEEPEVETKGQKYVLKQLQEHNVPRPFYVRIAQLLSGFNDFMHLKDMSTDAARNFRDMLKAEPNAIQDALEMAMERGEEPDDEEEEDF